MKLFLIGFIALMSLSVFGVEINCKGLNTNSTYAFKGLSTRIPFPNEVAPHDQVVKIYLDGQFVGRTTIFSEFIFLDKTYVFMSSNFEVVEVSKMRWVNGGFVFLSDGTMAAEIEYKIGRLWNAIKVQEDLECEQLD